MLKNWVVLPAALDKVEGIWTWSTVYYFVTTAGFMKDRALFWVVIELAAAKEEDNFFKAIEVAYWVSLEVWFVFIAIDPEFLSIPYYLIMIIFSFKFNF